MNDLPAARDAFDLACGFDPLNLCCRIGHVRSLGLVGDRRFAAEAAAAVTHFLAETAQWTDGASPAISLLRQTGSVADEAVAALEMAAFCIQERRPLESAPLHMPRSAFGDRLARSATRSPCCRHGWQAAIKNCTMTFRPP